MVTQGRRNPLRFRALIGACVLLACFAATWVYLSHVPGPTAFLPQRAATPAPTEEPRPPSRAELPAEKPAVVVATPQPVTPAIDPAIPSPVPPPAEAPKFDVVRISPQGNAVIAGRGAPGSDIIVFDGATEVARTRADSRGEFVALPALPLGPGGRELTLSSRTRAGTEVKGEEQVVLAVPDRPAPSNPAANPTAQPGSAPAPATPPAPVLAMILPQRGAPRVLQEPVAPPPPGSITLDTVDYDDTGAIQFKGAIAGPPSGSTIRVYVDNQPIGDSQSDPAGRWTLKPSAGVATGVHLVRADRLGADGAVLARIEMPFQRTEIAPAEVAAGRVVVQPGQNLWRLARAAYGRGVQYTVIYLANKDQIRDAQRIYPGQAFAIPER